MKSIVAEGDLLAYEKKSIIHDYHEINLSQLDFESLRKEFPVKEHKHIAFTDLREFMELKLQQMMRQNKSRGKFLESFEQIIDEYNNGSIEIDEAYEKLLEEAKALSEEESRAVKEGLNEEQLEIFDLLKKEKAEVKKASVKLKEKNFLLTHGTKKDSEKSWLKMR